MHTQNNRTPLVVSFGGGVDSTAMLVEMKNRGIRPDLILFADTGAEKPETYRHVMRFSEWLTANDFPAVTTVSYDPPIAPYDDLEGNCTMNETLPSLAFGRKSCSLKWKVTPQHKFLESWTPAVETWNSGEKVRRALGFDNSVADKKRSAKVSWAIGLDDSAADKKRAASYAGGAVDDDKYDYFYPLQDWGMNREGCEAVIEAAGIPVPPKSSCYFCPAMKKPEILELRETNPDLFDRALAMEDGYLAGKHHAGRKAKGLKCSTVGLGRRFSWREFVETHDAEEAAEGDPILDAFINDYVGEELIQLEVA